MPDRKPTVQEKVCARLFLSLAGTVALAWIVAGPEWVVEVCDNGTSNGRAFAVILGIGVHLLGFMVFVIATEAGLVDWLTWALSTPAEAEPDHFEAIDETRI